MFEEFYFQRTVEKETIHDADLELYAIYKKQEN
jgi:hypothetical protein